MEKMKQSIKNAMAKLNISQSELSKRIGYSRGYLGEMQRIGCSTTKQAKIAQLCDSMANGEVFKTDAQVIVELSEKLAAEQDKNVDVEAAYYLVCSELRKAREVAIEHMEKVKILDTSLLDEKKTSDAQKAKIISLKVDSDLLNSVITDLHRHRFVLFVGLVLSIIIGAYGWVN